MGTPLTSATVSSTYQALLKTSDNLPFFNISRMSDGLGNDSSLYLGPIIFNNRGIGQQFQNTVIGEDCFTSNTIGSENVIMGWYAAKNSGAVSKNVIIGSEAAAQATAAISQNVLIGWAAGGNMWGADNVFIGCTAGTFINQTCNSLVLIGSGAGGSSTGGNGSTVIGAAASHASFENSLVLGRNAIATASNQFVVGAAGAPTGQVLGETITPNITWTVRINGANYKIPMLAI